MAATMPVFHLEAEVVTLTRPTAVHAVRSQGPAFATCGEVRVCCHTSIGAIVAAADGSGGRSKKTAASPQLRKCGFTRGAKLQLQLLRPCSTSDDGAPLAASSAEDQAQRHERGGGGGDGDGAATFVERAPADGWKSFLSNYSAQRQDLLEKLQRYGSAGVLAYGLCNTLYYLCTFLFVWFLVTPSPGGLGFSQATQRFVKVFALVWAGSQVTKLLRAGGALAFAPAVDAGLSWFTKRFNIKSRQEAFGIVVAGCVALALVVFLVITSLWA